MSEENVKKQIAHPNRSVGSVEESPALERVYLNSSNHPRTVAIIKEK